jgi:hypothetical protein
LAFHIYGKKISQHFLEVCFLDFLLEYSIDSNYGSASWALGQTYPDIAAELAALPYYVPHPSEKVSPRSAEYMKITSTLPNLISCNLYYRIKGNSILEII